jgi:hypothetical protein
MKGNESLTLRFSLITGSERIKAQLVVPRRGFEMAYELRPAERLKLLKGEVRD